MCGKRGLLPDTDEQTFEVAVTQTFKIHYNKNITALQAEVTESIHPFIHPSIHSFIHPFIHSSIHPFIHPSIPPQRAEGQTNIGVGGQNERQGNINTHTHTHLQSSFCS